MLSVSEQLYVYIDTTMLLSSVSLSALKSKVGKVISKYTENIM